MDLTPTTTDEPVILVTIPTRPTDHTRLPSGWALTQIGIADDTVGLVAHDPTTLDLIIYTGQVRHQQELADAGWQPAARFATTTVFARPVHSPDDTAEAAEREDNR